MQMKMGKVSDVYAWFVTDEDGHILEQGYNEDVKIAREDAKTAVWFHTTHEYERN